MSFLQQNSNNNGKEQPTHFSANAFMQESHKLSAKELLFKYLIYLPLFIVFLGFSIGVAYFYIRWANPQYASSISLLIKDDKSGRYGGGGGEDMLMDNIIQYRKRANLANEIEVLKSTTLMTDVVKNLNLNVQYFADGNVRKSEMFTNPSVKAQFLYIKDSANSFSLKFKVKNKLLHYLVNDKMIPVQNGGILKTKYGDLRLSYEAGLLVPEYTYRVIWWPEKQLAANLAAALNVRQLNREASILVISINTEIAEKGRAILNELVKEYNYSNVEDKNRIADNTIQFIDERLSILTKELGGVEKGLQEFKQSNRLVNIEKQSELESNQLIQYKEKLDEQKIRLSVIEMISSYVANPAQRYQLVPSSLGIDDPTLLGLVKEYNELQLKREAELRTIPAAHPSVKLIENQIEKVRTSLLENLRNIRIATEKVAAKIDADYGYIQSQLRNIPRQQRELLEIMRQQGIKEKLYIFLLQKREDAAITRASEIGSAKFIDPAVTTRKPISPNTSNIYRIAFVIGLVIPFLIIYLRDLMNDRIRTRNDILKQIQAPLVGEIAHHKSKDRKLVVGVKDRSILAEQFRSVRTNLQFILHNNAKSIIMVTSSMAGEGKTFTSMNIGAVWALAGKRTVILELDLRKPKVSESLMIDSNEKGLTNYIVGKLSADELPVAFPDIPNLYVVPAGPIPPNPSEILMNRRMDQLMEHLIQHFDFIIMDTAPVGLVSDAKILSRFADATVYVLRQRYTAKKQLSVVNELYQSKVLPNMSLLVNDVKVGGANAYYGYGYTYGYGSNYNYEYDNTRKNKLNKIKEFLGI